MKLWFSGLRPGEEPITSIAEYMQARHQLDALIEQIHQIQMANVRLRDMGKEPDPRSFEELEHLFSETNQIRYAFIRRQPLVLVSRCPYCETSVWIKVGIFGLMDDFWYFDYSDGRNEVPERFQCPHLFCVDGALNLNGHQPTDAYAPPTVAINTTIRMAAQVPFLKPRVLHLPTMVAVVHSFPVAEKYTAYPIVYFAEQMPPQAEYCIGWARHEYVDHYRGGPPGAAVTGRRTDAQDYQLSKWVEWGKLFWLDPEDKEHPLVRGPVAAFPYGNVSGRRNPYTIKDGRVHNLPNPTKDGEPKERIEW